MKRLKKIEGEQLANATRHEVFDELLPEVPQAVDKPIKEALRKRALYETRKKMSD